MHTILVANRGEIACRVQQTAQRMGFRTVAVYSEADAGARHVQMADQSVCIGPGPAAQSYLNQPALLDAARRTGADAVHPGYGFLSENAGFAQACVDAGLVFIGPPPQAIAAMGSKARAKRLMQAAGVPTITGYDGEDSSEAAFVAAAQAMGYPVLVKAVAGGGGRGMRVVHEAASLPAALASARREAESAFGDGTLMLERLVPNGRHIEVQVFADQHGHILHLGERDCSTQRRRQKLIEETPSPIVTPALREALGQAAVAAAAAVGYVGAGTVEFIVDEQLRPYFLEMNTRLQVEHPVTESVTGLDLVEWQLRVAGGEALPLRQEDIVWQGHAIEARLIAEDPYDGWKPQAGTVLSWRPQDARVRVDHGLCDGQAVPPFYDAMVAKLVAHGTDRADAIRRLRRALMDAPLLGIPNNGGFLRALLAHPDFTQARMSTTRLDEWAAEQHPLLQRPEPPELAWRLAAAFFSDGLAQRPASVRSIGLRLCCGDAERTCRVPDGGVTQLALRDGWLTAQVDGVGGRWPAASRAGQGSPPAAGQQDPRGLSLHLAIDGQVWVLHEASDSPTQSAQHDPRQVRAPVTGTVAQVVVQVGDTVQAGQPLASVEAMKMEMWVKASVHATVTAIRAAALSPVSAGAVLIDLEPLPEPPHTPSTTGPHDV
jgi:geranyl-CoA carboxylase alpha subunit